MTCSSIMSYMTAKTMDIKLPVPITDAKTVFSFLMLHKSHYKKMTSTMACFFRTTF